MQHIVITLLATVLATQVGQCFYNPQTGRWLSRDPAEEKHGQNLHGFVGNDPVRRIDKLGLEVLCYYNESGVWTCRSPLCYCKCKKVTVQYIPGGDSLQTGWYLLGGRPRYGNSLVVQWDVAGD